MPQIKPWFTFAEWGKKYNKCLLLFQNSAFKLRAFQVLSRMLRSWLNITLCQECNGHVPTDDVYSDCPVPPMSGDLFGMKHSMGLLMYGDCLRQNRKNIGSRPAVDIYNPIEEIETHRSAYFHTPSNCKFDLSHDLPQGYGWDHEFF